jgi:hypothetical protein
MKFAFCLIALISLFGCASAPSIMSGCDGVANRDRVFVCGKSDVMKNFDPVPARDSRFVCDHL